MASVDQRVSWGFTSLWDPPDVEYYQSVVNQSDCYAEDWSSHPEYGYERDIIEEEALNEKYCLQVLRILIQKADEEIVKLDEEIVMLQCELEWKDEDWSKRCSAVLTERLDHLDALIRNLKEDDSKETNDSCINQAGELLPERLHDLLKPLLKNHISAKRKQKGNCGKQSAADESIIPVEQSEMKNLIMEPNDDNKNRPERPPNFTVHLKSDDRRRTIEDSRKLNYQSHRHVNSSSVKVENTNKKSSERAVALEGQATESGESEDPLVVSIGRRRGTKTSKSKLKMKLKQQTKELQNVEDEGPKKKKLKRAHRIENLKPGKGARKQVGSSLQDTS